MIVTDIPKNNENTNEPIRLAAYCRVSTNSDDQVHSFLAQVKHYREYEKEHPDCKLVNIFADEGITGTCMDKRENFKRMIQECRDGNIDKIIVKSVSRFARFNEECLTVLRELKEIGVSVFFEKENLDTGTMNSEFMISLFGMNAQQESINISENMRWSYQHRMKSGEFNTCKPALGYSLVNGKLQIVEEEAKIVRRIFDMFLSGMGKTAIAKKLNEEEVGKKMGFTKWYVYPIHYILTNERYMGNALLQKRYTTATLPFREKINHGEKEQYYVENSNEPIVSKETFQAVQDLIALRKVGNPIKMDEHSILQGIVRCGTCGKPMRRIRNARAPKWVCQGYSRQKEECSAHTIYETDLMNAFVTMINKLKDNQKELIDETIALMEKIIDICGGNHDRVAELNSEIADLCKRKYKVAQLYEKNLLNDQDFIIKNRDIDASLSKARSERRKLLSEDKQSESMDELLELKKIIEEYQKHEEFEQSMFEDIVNSIEVDENATITFHLIGGLNLKERLTIKSQ